MQETPAIRIADGQRVLYERDLREGADLPTLILEKLEADTDYMFSVYLPTKGKLLFMAILRPERKEKVSIRMAFHQGQPEHVCDVMEATTYLRYLAKCHLDNMESSQP